MRKEKEENASGREVQVLSSLDSVSTDDFFWLGCGDKLIDYGSESCCASFQCGEYLSYCWDESACVACTTGLAGVYLILLLHFTCINA
jgi:hypothetical protein